MGGNGAVAPHAAMTKTGHQAQRNVVNPADTDADVVTAFHPDSETERTLLFGSNFVEIQPSTAASNFGSSQTFTFSNDVDAIGDVYARVMVDCTSAGTISDEGLARIIDRVEVMVGNSTWQTMENADVIAMYRTTLDAGACLLTNAQASGQFVSPVTGQQAQNLGIELPESSTMTGGKRELWMPLNIFTAGGPSRAHLVAGAPHQSFRIKLTYGPANGPGLTSLAAGTKPEVELWARQHIMTNFERDQIRSNTIAKTLYLTQHMDAQIGGEDTKSVECDSFSLLASHLILTFEGDNGLADSGPFQGAELLLNTSSHSGTLDAGFMMAQTGSSMGLKCFAAEWLQSDGNSEQNRAVYVFPIASTPFGPDGCPFNRFDTIRLRLSFAASFTGKVSVTCCGTASAVYAKQAASLQYHS